MSQSRNGSHVKTVARLMWLGPALLVAISIALLRAGFDERTTLESGTLVTAEVVDVNIRNRADVTYGHIDLRVPTPEGEVIERRLPLPLSLLIPLEDEKELAVWYQPASSTDVVIDFIARAQWKMALIHAGMSALGAILLAIGVFAWNRFLGREGDPADVSQ